MRIGGGGAEGAGATAGDAELLTSVRVYAMAAVLRIPSLMVLARDRFDWAVERQALDPMFPAVIEVVYRETEP